MFGGIQSISREHLHAINSLLLLTKALSHLANKIEPT